ncbi:MAG: hypothetical protein WBU20_16470, partial [Candidatus Acidiferrum sp.]
MALTAKQEEIIQNLTELPEDTKANWDGLAKDIFGWPTDELRKYVAERRAARPVIVEAQLDGENIADMPVTVLCGKLGEIYMKHFGDFPLAYAWPAILCAASVMIVPHPTLRANLFAALIGPIHSGKTEITNRVTHTFTLEDQGLFSGTKFGSSEGFARKIGERAQPLLWCPDELSHLLEKSRIQSASFPFFLDSVFNHDRNDLVVAKGKQLSCSVRLSLIGGIVADRFEDSFGSGTTAGLYDRFLFGVFPQGNFTYKYRPMTKSDPIFEIRDSFGPNGSGTPKLVTPMIHSSVWDAKDKIQDEGINPGILEIAIRCALICAAWDHKDMLVGSSLDPFWELARYQERV